jgi:hypothetical protein
LEQEFITGDMSVRELVRRHGFANASSVHAQARQGEWFRKRAEYRDRASAMTIERMADVAARRAERQLEVREHAVEVIDAALTALQENLHKTRRIQHAGEWTEEPLVVVGPKDVALLLDRLATLSGRPSEILEQRSVDVHVQPTDLAALAAFAEYARQRATLKVVGPDALPTGPAINAGRGAEQ